MNSILLYREKKKRFKVGFWSILFIAILVSTFVGDLPDTRNLYYATLVINFVFLVIKRKKIEYRVLLFLLFLPLTIIINHPDPLFKSWMRLGAFFLVLISASPLIQSVQARHFRISCLRVVLIASVVISIVSFAFYFLDINYMVSYDTSDYLERAGMFGGLTRHSMMLGPVSSMGSIYCVYLALKTKNKIFWLLAIPCIGSVLFAASRLAFAGMLASMIVLLYMYSRRKSYFLKVLLGVLAVLLITQPLWDKGLERLRMKQQERIETRGIALGARGLKWEHRLNEFQHSPFFGVGFCAMDTQYTSDYNEESGGMEPGSSWLAVLSMTGLIGLVLFLCVFLYSGRVVIKRKNNDSMLLLALLVFFIIHFIGEGYIFSSGGALCYLAWIVIGCSYDMKYHLSEDII